MKIKKTFLFLLSFFLISVGSIKATINGFRFAIEIVDANGTNVRNCFNVCSGETFYIRNKSTMGSSGCIAGSTPINAPLNGTLTALFGTTTVLNITVTNWGYNDIIPIVIYAPISGSINNLACGNGHANVYFYYYGSDVNTSVCSTINYHQHMRYGRVNALPAANAGSDVSICSGQSTTLTASGGSTYVWNGGTLVNAGGASQLVSPTVTTSYTVTVTNSSGCSSSDVVTVTVNPLPTNNLQNYTLCPGDDWPVLDAGAGYASYAWYFNGGGIGIGQTMPTSSFGYGTYSVIITSASGCTATYSSVVSLSSSANLDATFTLSIQTYSNNTAVITATANAFSGNNTWELHNSNSNCYEQFIPAQSYTYSGIFNGHAQTFTAVATGNWYVIKHIASSRPCNIPATSTTCIYIGNNQRIMFEQTDGVVVSNNQLVTSFYPNPSDGKINLEISGTQEGQPTTVEIVDMQGRVVSNTEYASVSGPVSIDLTNEAKGIYFVRVINGENISTEKIVIE